MKDKKIWISTEIITTVQLKISSEAQIREFLTSGAQKPENRIIDACREHKLVIVYIKGFILYQQQ